MSALGQVAAAVVATIAIILALQGQERQLQYQAEQEKAALEDAASEQADRVSIHFVSGDSEKLRARIVNQSPHAIGWVRVYISETIDMVSQEPMWYYIAPDLPPCSALTFTGSLKGLSDDGRISWPPLFSFSQRGGDWINERGGAKRNPSMPWLKLPSKEVEADPIAFNGSC